MKLLLFTTRYLFVLDLRLLLAKKCRHLLLITFSNFYLDFFQIFTQASDA
jgi:hypothetical protein